MKLEEAIRQARYGKKIKAAHWPDFLSLDEIQSLSKEDLIIESFEIEESPFRPGDFVYKLNEDGSKSFGMVSNDCGPGLAFMYYPGQVIIRWDGGEWTGASASDLKRVNKI